MNPVFAVICQYPLVFIPEIFQFLFGELGDVFLIWQPAISRNMNFFRPDVISQCRFKNVLPKACTGTFRDMNEDKGVV